MDIQRVEVKRTYRDPSLCASEAGTATPGSSCGRALAYVLAAHSLRLNPMHLQHDAQQNAQHRSYILLISTSCRSSTTSSYRFCRSRCLSFCEEKATQLEWHSWSLADLARWHDLWRWKTSGKLINSTKFTSNISSR